MKIRKLKRNFIWIIKKVMYFLPVFFVSFLIFGFNEPEIACITLASALTHEAGHLCCILRLRVSTKEIRGVLSGFRIRPVGYLSYDDLIKVYLAGPCVNIFIFVISALLIPLWGDFMAYISIINLATALSNLLPIQGYDGYGILRAIIDKNEKSEFQIRLLCIISTMLTLTFCIISLYFVDRLGGGYWVFVIFFLSMIKSIKTDLAEQ